MADDPLVQRLLDMEIGPPVGTVPPDSFADGLRGMALAEAAPAGPAPAPEDDSDSTGDEGHVDADDIEGSDFGSAGPPLYSLKDADSDGEFGGGEGGDESGVDRAAAYQAGPCADQGTDNAAPVSMASMSGEESPVFTDLASAAGEEAARSVQRPCTSSASPPASLSLASERTQLLEQRRRAEEAGEGLGVGVTDHIRALAAGAGVGGEQSGEAAQESTRAPMVGDEGLGGAVEWPDDGVPSPADHPSMGRQPDPASLPFGGAFNEELLGALASVVAAAGGGDGDA